MIRAMALGEVTLRDWWHVMRRELQAGFALGLILGVIGVIRWDLAICPHPFTYGEESLACCLDRGHCARRRGAMGLAGRFDATISVAPCRSRSRNILRAFRGHPCRCDWTVIYFNVALFILRGTLL